LHGVVASSIQSGDADAAQRAMLAIVTKSARSMSAASGVTPSPGLVPDQQ
jgi:DNA-binding FadR family transcriptional regulator